MAPRRLALALLVGAFEVLASACGSATPTSPFPPPLPPSLAFDHTSVTSVSPTRAVAGSPDVTVTIIGTNFVQWENHMTSRAVWEANKVITDLETRFVSSTELTAVIPARLLSTPVSARIWVFTEDIQSDAHRYFPEKAVRFEVVQSD